MEWVRGMIDFIYSLYIRTVLKASQATRTGRHLGFFFSFGIIPGDLAVGFL
jgi:hypothetical protein